MELTAVLIDTVSNQEYIFSGNRLRENLGGSYLLKEAYDGPLKRALDGTAPGNAGTDAWKTSDSSVSLRGGAEVGYVGGGNALLFFDGPERGAGFVREFTRLLLKSRPGLNTAFGFMRDFRLDEFKVSMKALHDRLYEARNRSFPRTIPPMHGFTEACPYSGQTAELGREDSSGKLVSALSFSRISCSDAAREWLTSKVRNQMESLDFTDEIGELGQVDDRSYMAVVHIDGNSMGRRFMECGDLGGLRRLSCAVYHATFSAFSSLVADATGVVRKLAADRRFNFGKTLPLRPVIIGGDDVTFVCEGRLALYFAERFMNHIATESGAAGCGFNVCAGVSIVKSKYPFFKAYKLAEDLCEGAKRESRVRDDMSYLDYLISSGGFSGSVESIRRRHFVSTDGRDLHYGPYHLGRGHQKSIATLRDGVKMFHDDERWSRAQAMNFRELLADDHDQCRNFVLTNRLKLPDIPSITNSVAQLASANPFYDMLDAMDFYPRVLLDEVEL